MRVLPPRAHPRRGIPGRSLRPLLVLFPVAGLLGVLAACEEDAVGLDPEPRDRILFLTDRDYTADLPTPDLEVYGVNVDGTGAVNLSLSPAQYHHPRLSPDGQRLAIESDESGCLNVWVMGTDGTARTQLTGHETGERCNILPVWSPDGSRIAYGSSNEPELGWEVWVMTASGSGKANVTGNPSTDYETYGDLPHGWTPDGRLVIVSTRDGTSRPWVMDADGSGAQPLFDDTAYQAPYWSPDGSRIAVASSSSGSGDLHVMNADGTGVVELTSGTRWDWFAAAPTPWSPDGTRIAFHGTVDQNRDIYIINADGTGLVRVTDDPGDDRFNGWSPDGTRLLITSNRSGNDDVYLVDPDGGSLVNLTKHEADDGDAVWVPHS